MYSATSFYKLGFTSRFVYVLTDVLPAIYNIVFLTMYESGIPQYTTQYRIIQPINFAFWLKYKSSHSTLP